MGLPERKPQNSDSTPPLKVVQGGVHRETRALTTFFLVLAALATVTVLYLAQQSANPSASFESLYDWHNVLDRNGTDRFGEQKQKYRSQVERGLNTRHASNDATGLALYLFPELLPDDDFQKYEAFQLWVPHQRQIEAAPGTLESRIQFERMRTNVWNFETADKQSPLLTEPARQMLRVYDQLSRPR